MREQYNDLTAKKIGSRLRQIREGRGLTQKEVADGAQITEVIQISQTSIKYLYRL